MSDFEFDDPRARDALRDAGEARERSYAPYSRFRMGAAVVTDRNAVVPGALVENVSLGLAMCAERVAMFAAVAGGTRPRGLVLDAPRTAGAVTMPCGACLQTALELGGPDLRIGSVDGEHLVEAAVSQLLPRGPHRS